MDFEEQNKIVEDIEEFLDRKLRGKEFYAIIGISDQENGLMISTGTLADETQLKYWKIIAGGLLRESEQLAKNLELPKSGSFNKPVEPK